MKNSHSFLLFLFLVLFIVFTVILSDLSEAILPEIYSISPNTGGNVMPTQVTIKGSGFAPTFKAALYGGGGPYIIGSCDTPGYALGIYVSGSYAFVTYLGYVADAYSSGLQVIDISNPNTPSIAGSCATPGSAFDIYVSGSYAYIAYSYYANEHSGIQVIDISNPNTPSIIGSCNTPGYALGIYVSGSYAYMADGESGLQVIDISNPNPNNPSIVGSCDTRGQVWPRASMYQAHMPIWLMVEA